MRTIHYYILSAVFALHALLLVAIDAISSHRTQLTREEFLVVQTLLPPVDQTIAPPMRPGNVAGGGVTRRHLRQAVIAWGHPVAMTMERHSAPAPSDTLAGPTFTESAIRGILKLDSADRALGSDTVLAQPKIQSPIFSTHEIAISRAIAGATKVDCLDAAKQGEIKLGPIGVSGLLMAVPEMLGAMTGHGC